MCELRPSTSTQYSVLTFPQTIKITFVPDVSSWYEGKHMALSRKILNASANAGEQALARSDTKSNKCQGPDIPQDQHI